MARQAKTITVSWGRLKRLGKEINDRRWAYDRWADWEDDDDWISAHMVAEDIGEIWEMFEKLAPELAEEIEKGRETNDKEGTQEFSQGDKQKE